MIVTHYQIETENQLESLPFNGGTLYFTKDTERIFLDPVDGSKRILLNSDPIIISTESDRENLLAPIPGKIYFVTESSTIYIYYNSVWYSHNSALIAHINNTTAHVTADDHTKLGYLNGVSENVQTQIDNKAPKEMIITITRTGSSTFTSDHTFSEILECYNAGGYVYILRSCTSGSYKRIFNISEISDTEIVFLYSGYDYIYGGTANALVYETYTIDNTNTVTHASKNTYHIPSLPISVSNGGTGCNSLTDTVYTTARYRASALVSEETDPAYNGIINWIYE